MAALTVERVGKYLTALEDIAEKMDSLRGLVFQLQKAKSALNQNFANLHTDHATLATGVNARITGKDYSPDHVRELEVTLNELEKFFDGSVMTVPNVAHGDRVKRLSKVLP